MDGEIWTDASSRENADRGRPAGKGGVRLPRVPLRARDEMATQEEPEEAEGDDPAKDEAQQWSKPTGNHQRREPHDEGLV